MCANDKNNRERADDHHRHNDVKCAKRLADSGGAHFTGIGMRNVVLHDFKQWHEKDPSRVDIGREHAEGVECTDKHCVAVRERGGGHAAGVHARAHIVSRDRNSVKFKNQNEE